MIPSKDRANVSQRWASGFALLLVMIASPQVQARPGEADTPVVEVIPVIQGALREFEFAQGTVHASRREYLVFEGSGTVDFVRTGANGDPLREGEPVRAGELLASLETDTEDASYLSAQASLEAARAGLKSAQASYQRAENLKAGGAISERDYERAVSSLEQSRARVESAEAQLVRSSGSLRGAQLIAPFDGVLAFVNIREGQYLARGTFNASTEAAALRTAPMVIIDPRTFEVVVDVPSFIDDRLAVGQAAFVLRQETLTSLQTVGAESAAALVQQLLPADVVSVSPAINPEDRSIRTRVEVRGSVQNLRDGEHVTVWLVVGLKSDALVVPAAAIVRREGQPSVFVVGEDSRVQRRSVELGLVGLEGVEILGGVSVGERVITAGKHRVRAGEAVRVASPQPGRQ